MPISYPNSNTIIVNVSGGGGGGGDGNATSIASYPINSGSLLSDQVLKFDGSQWVPADFFVYVTLLATPTYASATTQQEITRFNFANNNNPSFTFNYSLQAGQTGSLELSSSIDQIIIPLGLVSGTSDVERASFTPNISSSQPYYLIASSSDTSSQFTIYNCVMAVTNVVTV